MKKLKNKEEILQKIRGGIELALNFSPVILDIIVLAQSQVWFKIVLVFKKTAFSTVQMSITSNLEQSDSLVYFIGALDI